MLTRTGTQWHKGTGIVRYDPPRPGLKKKTKWWCVLTVDREITRYYRWWVTRMLHVHLHPPSWDAHVSIIRGEKPPQGLEHLWKKYHGHKFEFEYRHNVRQTGDTTGKDRPDNYWFIDVHCPSITKVREELGFPTSFGYHMTIGRTWD